MTSEGDGLDQTQYLACSRLYDDPATPPEPLDLHSAAAIGNYECVQEAIKLRPGHRRQEQTRVGGGGGD